MSRLHNLSMQLGALQEPAIDALVQICEMSAPGTSSAFMEIMQLLSMKWTNFTHIEIDEEQIDDYGMLSVGMQLELPDGKSCAAEMLFCVDDNDVLTSIAIEVRDLQLLLAEMLERLLPESSRNAIEPLVREAEHAHTRFTVTHQLLPSKTLLFDAEFTSDKLAFPELTGLQLNDVSLRLTRYDPNQAAIVRIGARLTPDMETGDKDKKIAWPAVQITLPLSTGRYWQMRLLEPMNIVSAPLLCLSLVDKLFGNTSELTFTSLHDAMPEPLKIVDDILLTEFDLKFNPFEGKGLFHSLDLTLKLDKPIPLGAIATITNAGLELRIDRHVRNLRLTGSALFPGNSWCSTGVNIPLGSMQEDWILEVEAAYQPTSNLQNMRFLNSSEPVLQNGLHSEFLELDAINVSNFMLSFNPYKAQASELNLDLEIDGGVKILPYFSVEQPEFKLYIIKPFSSKERAYSGSLVADVTVLGLPFHAGASRHIDGDWEFSAIMDKDGLTLETMEKNSGLPLPKLPPHLALISVDYIYFKALTKTPELTFSWQSTLPILLDDAQKPILSLHLSSSLDVQQRKDDKNNKSYDIDFRGEVDIGNNALKGGVSRKENQWKLNFGWSVSGDAKREDTLGIDTLMHLLGQPEALPALPPELDFRLQSFEIIGELSESTRAIDIELKVWQWGTGLLQAKAGQKGKESSTLFAAGALIERTLYLSQLPVVGKLLPSALDVGLSNPWIVAANRLLTSAEIASFATQLGVDKVDGMKGGQFAVGVNMKLGTKSMPLMLEISPGKRKAKVAELVFVERHPSMVAAPIIAQEATASSDAPAPNLTKWFDLQKNIGPLNVRRIGVRMIQGRLGVLVDGAVQVGGLTLEADGLGLSSPLNTFSPQFHLSGLGIMFERDPVLVGAGLRVCDESELSEISATSSQPVSFAMSGTSVLKVSQFSISGVGGLCAFKDGTTATFIFSELRAPIGGDPAFFITGFSGGLGINYNLRLPAIGEVWSCPFVAGLYTPDPNGKTPTPLMVLDRITRGKAETPAWLRPMPGNVWLAGGIRFTTYKMIETNAVAVAVIGSELSFSLMGICTANLPLDSTSPIACIEVEFQASIQPKSGYVGLGGGLTPRSWLLVRECVLSGSVAACWWFNPSHPDFVISAGGYHPAFDRPQAWPALNRLGFNWRYDDKVTIKGAVYGALTPSAVMAGGMLDASYESGNLKAWFRAWADFIMRYHPLTFSAEVGIIAGVAYDMNFLLFRTKIRLELSAQLRLSGPPLRGEVILHLYLFDVHVTFGQTSPKLPPPNWQSVKSAILAHDEHRIVFSMDSGMPGGQTIAKPVQSPTPLLLKTTDTTTPSETLPTHASTRGFSIEVSLSAPATVLKVNDAIKETCKPFAVRPCNISHAEGIASLHVTRRDGAEVAIDKWTCKPRYAAQAAGLWGAPESDAGGSINGDRFTHELITGLSIVSPAAHDAGNPLCMASQKAKLYATIALEHQPAVPLSGNAAKISASAEAQGSSFKELQDFANDAAKQTRERRLEILSALGFPLTKIDSGNGIAEAAKRHFPTEPRIIRPLSLTSSTNIDALP